jgi:hypothetical protein
MDTMNPLGANEPHTGRRGLTIMTCVLTTGKRRRDHDYIGVYALYATRSLSLTRARPFQVRRTATPLRMHSPYRIKGASVLPRMVRVKVG